MGETLKKLYRKTAAALVASMLMTSIVPMTGFAGTYGINGVYSEGSDYDLSEYAATASVALGVKGDTEMTLTEGSGTAELTPEYAIEAKATASNGTLASDTDWTTVEASIEEEIAKNLSITATISNADEKIKEFVSLEDHLDQDGKVTVQAEGVPTDLEDGEYRVKVEFELSLDQTELGENIHVNVQPKGSVTVTIKKESGSVAGTSSITLNGFHEDDEDGKTWIYMDGNLGEPADPVQLNYEVEPEGAKVTFTSSDTNVASVSDKGELTPKSNGVTTITATVEATGNYTASEARMVVEIWTSKQDAEFSFSRGFNNETENDEGIIKTGIYMENGVVNDLLTLCGGVPDGAKITFTSSDESVARVEDRYLIGTGTGTVTITAEMEAPGYKTAADTLIVDVWKYELQDNLPQSITIRKGETWSRTFAAPLRDRTRFVMVDENLDEIGDDTLKLTVPEDKSSIAIEAKKPGRYELYYRCHDESLLTTFDEWMEIVVLEEGVSLELSADQLVMEPGKTASFDVKYSPENADIDLEWEPGMLDVDYADGRVTVTSFEESGVSDLYVYLLDDEGQQIAAKTVRVVVAEKQLEAAAVTEALVEANDKVKDAIDNGNEAEFYKIVNEIVEILVDAPQSEVSANKENIDKLEEELSRVAAAVSEVHGDEIEIETSGALLNLLSKGEVEGKVVVVPLKDTSNTAGVTLDIKLQKGRTGDNITKLAVPMQIRVKVTGIDLTKNVRIRHTKEDGTAKWIYPDIDGEYIVFWVDSFSKFAISNYTTGGSGGGGGGGGGRTTGSSAAGTVSSDPKKGYVNSVTGIVTGGGAGYSSWVQDGAGWKLRYADGTFAVGFVGTDEKGSPYEQVVWEMVNGAWYPFGADGCVRSGLVYDAALAGTFYVDINSGMKTGWQTVDGVWRYFSTVSDGKRGIMLTDTTVDGYDIDGEGIWRETAE